MKRLKNRDSSLTLLRTTQTRTTGLSVSAAEKLLTASNTKSIYAEATSTP
jgi:hypothetical protein